MLKQAVASSAAALGPSGLDILGEVASQVTSGLDILAKALSQPAAAAVNCQGPSATDDVEQPRYTPPISSQTPFVLINEIVALPSLETVPSLLSFLNAYELCKLSTTSRSMKLNANNEAKNQLKNRKVSVPKDQKVLTYLRREEQRPLFMTQVGAL